MSLVVYAITDWPDIAGLHDGALRAVAHGELAAVVSERSTSLWEYEQVMERLMAERTILPMRFGTALADERAVEELLRERGSEFAARLERVAGAIELAVRAGWRQSGAPGATPETGTAYMLDRVAFHRRARQLADCLDPLAALARDMRRRLVDRADLPVLGAYLVDRDRVAEFAERLGELDRRHPELELVCTGPWPPYSFAAGGAA